MLDQTILFNIKSVGFVLLFLNIFIYFVFLFVIFFLFSFFINSYLLFVNSFSCLCHDAILRFFLIVLFFGIAGVPPFIGFIGKVFFFIFFFFKGHFFFLIIFVFTNMFVFYFYIQNFRYINNFSLRHKKACNFIYLYIYKYGVMVNLFFFIFFFWFVVDTVLIFFFFYLLV